MEIPQKKAWSKPILKKLEVTDELLHLFRSHKPIADDLESFVDQRRRRAVR